MTGESGITGDFDKRLVKRYEELKVQLSKVGYICSGSVMTLYRKCGKQGCSCKGNETALHGPYHIWTRKSKGKTITRSLSSEQASLCSEYMQNQDDVASIIEEMKQISCQIVEGK